MEGAERDGRKRSYSGKVKRFLGASFRRGVRECLAVRREFNTFVILRGYVRRLKQKEYGGCKHTVKWQVTAAVLLSADIRRNGEINGRESYVKCDPSRAEAHGRIPIDLTANGHINSARCVRRGKIEHNAAPGVETPADSEKVI